MKQFDVTLWEKIQIWRATDVKIEAKTKEEALEIAKSFVSDGEVIVPQEYDIDVWFGDDESTLTPEQNEEKATIQIHFIGDLDMAYENA